MSRIKRLKYFLFRLFSFIGFLGRYFVPNPLDKTIRQAINEKRLLEFDYDGFQRIVEPHVYGRKNEEDAILVYQKRGQSSSGILGWKRMKLKGITDMTVLDETFPGIRPVSGRHSTWDVIYLIVS